MHPETLREHIRKCKAATAKPFGVNVPLMYPQIEELMQILVEEQVQIVFTSAGNPKTWTRFLKDHGMKVVHVVSSSKFALKCEEAGVDAIVAEGFEAGGHNGREETTTLCLIPAVRRATSLPLIAAGGIGTGEAILAVQSLGAEGVQIGTRFALTTESSAHEAFKQLCLNLKEGDTKLLLKKLSPTRLVKGDFMTAVEEAEARGASVEEMKELLGRGRAKRGIFEGDLAEGELEIGQVASLFHQEQSVAAVMHELVTQYEDARLRLQGKAVIYIAGGCFWGTEHFFKQIRGVEQTQVGYANGHAFAPAYQEVKSGETGAAETVRVVYDPHVISLQKLLELYFQTIDPTSVNEQGEDCGTQYRTGIYFTHEAQLPVIRTAISQLAGQYEAPIAIEVQALDNFYRAEEYHQDYLDKNPTGYCHIRPELFKMAREANPA